MHFAEPLQQQDSQDEHMADVEGTTQGETKGRLSKSALKKLKARKRMKKLGIKKGHFYF